MHGLPEDEWGRGRLEVRGEGAGRPDARGDAGLGGADQQRRPAALHRAGPVRPRRTGSCSGSTPVCCGWWRRSPRRWARSTWATSGTAPWPTPSPAARCSPRCRCTCGAGTCSGTTASCARHCARCRRRTSRARRGAHPPSASPYGQAFIIGILLEQGEIAEARRYVDGVLHQPRIGDGARLFDENHARLMAAEGRHAEALAALEAATDAADHRWSTRSGGRGAPTARRCWPRSAGSRRPAT